MTTRQEERLALLLAPLLVALGIFAPGVLVAILILGGAIVVAAYLLSLFLEWLIS